ncbi:MAG: hypothetical protein WA885_16345 [Phormidesmis sp.]
MSYRLWFLFFSLFLYGLAQALPCLEFTFVPTEYAQLPADLRELSHETLPDRSYAMAGIELSMGGMVGLLMLQISAIGWLANPLYWASAVLFMRQQYSYAVTLGGLAVLIGGAGTALAFRFPLPAGSGPGSAMILNSMLIGFWVWLAAPGAIATAAALHLAMARRA